MRLLLPALLLVLAGCPDPSQSPPPGGPNAMGAPPGGGGPPGGSPSSMRPKATFKVEPGTGVKLSGVIEYAGAKTGTLRLDFLRSSGSQFPELVHSMTLGAAGPFELEAPKDFGSVMVMAFIDSAEDGPSAGEPAGRWDAPVEIKDQPISGLNITLSDTPDLKDLAPPGAGGASGAPPGGAPGGPPGGAPGGAPNPAGGMTPAGPGAPPPPPPSGP